MPSVVFYISGHGFGHASRDVEVLNLLGGTGHRLIVRSAVSPALLERTMRVPYDLRPGVCDTGVVQRSSIANDDERTVREALAFYADFPARIAAEQAALAGDDVRLVVGDIAPLAFEVAARLGVPGVALANFTWDWIYETFPDFLPAGAPALASIRAAYRRADLALALPFSGGFEVFGRVQPVPLVARRPTQTRAAARAHFGLPDPGQVALLSFGGFGLPALDLTRLDCSDTWTIVTSDRVSTQRNDLPPHVTLLDEAETLTGPFRYEDLVAAVDVVITKPGFGILAECISTGTPLLYTSRGAFREYDLLVREMPRFTRCRFIEQQDLLAGRWREALDALVVQPPPPERMAVDGADVVAGVLAGLLD